MPNAIIREAYCGVKSPAYLPNQWKDDKHGLADRRECKLCPVKKVRDEKKEESLQS